MRIVRRKGASALFWHVLLLVGNCSATVALSVSSSSASATPGEENLRKTFSAPSQTKQCVIVGGGPIGLATALTLSRPPHSYAVTVLEQSAGATAVKKYDPTRSYLYNINPRGLNWFEEVAPASAIQKLSMAGYAPKNGVPLFVIVPADPEVPIPPPKPAAISGRVQLMNRTNYWIPRHQMVAALLECCREQNDLADSATGVIDVCAGKQVDSVVPADDHSLVVHCRDGSSYPASLVVAADGIDSAVWSCLADASARTWLQSHFQRFRIRRYRSPSTGLKLKALQLPPHFALPNTNGTTFQPDSTTILGIRGVNKGSRNTLSLGMLPMKDGHLIRPANTNTPYDHEIWSLQTGTQAKAWFAKNFPRLPWENLVDDVEWERFIRAKGTTFPHCQYSPGSAVASPNGMTGVVMVGDACECFVS